METLKSYSRFLKDIEHTPRSLAIWLYKSIRVIYDTRAVSCDSSSSMFTQAFAQSDYAMGALNRIEERVARSIYRHRTNNACDAPVVMILPPIAVRTESDFILKIYKGLYIVADGSSGATVPVVSFTECLVSDICSSLVSMYGITSIVPITAENAHNYFQ